MDYELDSPRPFDNIANLNGIGSGTQAIDLVYGSVTSNTTLSSEPIPWLFSFLVIPANVNLTIDPGAVIKGQGGGGSCDAINANLCVDGTLNAVGNGKPAVVFASVNDNTTGETGSGTPQAGDWAGIEFPSRSERNSVELGRIRVRRGYCYQCRPARCALGNQQPVLLQSATRSRSQVLLTTTPSWAHYPVFPHI